MSTMFLWFSQLEGYSYEETYGQIGAYLRILHSHVASHVHVCTLSSHDIVVISVYVVYRIAGILGG